MKGLEKGLIQIYTGGGKGKTTAVFGLALRALGQGLTVYIIQFMKGRGDGGEVKALQRWAPDCRVENYGEPAFVRKGEAKAEDVAAAVKALRKAKEAVHSGQWDLVILDEVINAVWFELLAEEELLAVLESKLAQVEVVLTGRNASEALKNKADLITEMVQIKHPYEKGIQARQGIEY
ncbi:MAG: cob(I)yrinic acid a,c-diamide adenosyltransferase [Peptococcaceae bacterium]|jgi:cob(I)alamin adenosyltransferase|nr:cob(I)yrinic acid a,c-diamide adenosyltransferase [Peptococcaceae bacterium]